MKLEDYDRALEVFHKGRMTGLSLLSGLIRSAAATLDEISSAVADLRHFILCAASFLKDRFPELSINTFIQWKNLFSEIHSILIRLGLRANNRVLFQVLRDPLLVESREEQLRAFEFHQSTEKAFIQMHFPHVLQALAIQNHSQISDALQPGDILLDYVLDVYHPDFDPRKEPRNDPLCFITLLQKDRQPRLFQLNLSAIHEKYSHRSGQDITHKELPAICSDLGKHIFPKEVCQLLNEGNMKRLLICPDSYLHDFPLESIQGETHTPLFESFTVVRLSSPRELLREQVVASLRLLYNPTLSLKQSSPATPGLPFYSKLLDLLRLADIETTLSKESLLREAFGICGLQLQVAKAASSVPDSMSPNHDIRIPVELETVVPIRVHLSPVFLQALQNSASKNIDSLKSRVESLKQPSKCIVSSQTKSLSADCYLVGDPKFDLDVAPVEESVGCIAALTSMFWLSDPVPVKKKLEALPETQREIDTVEHLLSSSASLQVKQPLVGSDATVANLLDLESPFVLHIATHGVAKSSIHTQAHRSYWSDTSTALLFAGAQTYLDKQLDKLSFHSGLGCLTPASAVAVNLEGTRLVFGSTCRSGIGIKPFHETSESMMQAFHAAGAQTVISTLWPVDDSLTADFTATFYKQLIENPACRPSEALACTKKLFLDEQEPFSAWGAFICSGIDQPLFPESATKAQEIQMVSVPL